jgi:hypothetical protein
MILFTQIDETKVSVATFDAVDGRVGDTPTGYACIVTAALVVDQ